jgi:hypothetical protein
MNRLDPVAVNIASYLPQVTTPGANNLPVTWRNILNRHAVVVRGDYQIIYS